MALKLLHTQGIELSLDEYSKLRAFQGGGWFWDHENQQVIRECLGEFLPRVEERPDRAGAVFQHFDGGGEVSSRSRAVGRQMDRVPKGQLDRLQRAIETLKRKTQDAQADPNARQIIDRFRLPDPAKDPELYRLYGSPWNRKLLVLWGCEREPGTSLAPFSALSKMPVEPRATTWLRRLPLLLGLLLLLLLALFLAVTLLHRHPHDDTVLAGVSPNIVNVEPGHPGSVGTDRPPVVGLPMNGSTDRPAASTDTAPAGVEGDGSQSLNTLPPRDSTTGRAAPPEAIASAKTGAPLQGRIDSHPGLAAPPSVSTAPDVSPVPATPPAMVTDNSPPATHGRPGDVSVPSPAVPPAAAPPRSTAKPPESAPADENHVGPPATGAGAASASAKVTMIEIINAKSAPSPKGGKVDALLIVVGHGEHGETPPVKIMRWTIDGVPQLDADHRAVTASQLNARLTPGKHRVGVNAASADGEALETESMVDVQLHTQSDVKILPGGNR